MGRTMLGNVATQPGSDVSGHVVTVVGRSLEARPSQVRLEDLVGCEYQESSLEHVVRVAPSGLQR